MSSGDGFGNNLIIFGVDISSVHADNRKKNILILDKGPTDGLDDTTIPEEAEDYVLVNKTRYSD